MYIKWDKDISLENDISAFIHCMKCIQELPEDKSPREWVHLEVGITEDQRGFQVWCVRHELNVGLFTVVENPSETPEMESH